MFKAIKKKLNKKKREIEQKREIAHMRRVRQEKIDDAAYWYIQGDYKEYLRSQMEAVNINGKILIRRREAV